MNPTILARLQEVETDMRARLADLREWAQRLDALCTALRTRVDLPEPKFTFPANLDSIQALFRTHIGRSVTYPIISHRVGSKVFDLHLDNRYDCTSDPDVAVDILVRWIEDLKANPSTHPTGAVL